jgi:hypothetical protein
MPRRTKRDPVSQLNRNINRIVRSYVQGCTHGTCIDAKDLSRQLTGEGYTYMARSVKQILRQSPNVNAITQMVFQVM